jgi:hypothetical protein
MNNGASLLRLYTANKPHTYPRVSRRFESIVTLQGKITWQQDTREPRRYHEWPPFALTIKESSRAHRTLVPSSTRKPRRGSPWVARTLSQWHPWSTVGCRPTQRPSMVLSLRDPINPVCVSTQLNACCNMAQPTRSLIDTGGGYHLEAPNLTSDHSHPSHPVFPTFP